MKLKPISRVASRQLVGEIPDDLAPDQIVVGADNRLRRVPAGPAVQVRTLSLWSTASEYLAVSLTDRSRDHEFKTGVGISLQLYGLRLGADPLTPLVARPSRADDLPAVTRLVLANRGILQSEVPTALRNIDLNRLQQDDERLELIKWTRQELRLLDKSLGAAQAQIENRIAPVLDLIYTRSRSVIDCHLELQERLAGLHDYFAGAAEEAAEKRKERDREFQRGVEAGQQAQAAEQAQAAAPLAASPIAASPIAVPRPPAPQLRRIIKR